MKLIWTFNNSKNFLATIIFKITSIIISFLNLIYSKKIFFLKQFVAILFQIL
jgi:hypothetical protein